MKVKSTKVVRNVYSKLSSQLHYCRLLLLIFALLVILFCLEYSPPRSQTVQVEASYSPLNTDSPATKEHSNIDDNNNAKPIPNQAKRPRFARNRRSSYFTVNTTRRRRKKPKQSRNGNMETTTTMNIKLPTTTNNSNSNSNSNSKSKSINGNSRWKATKQRMILSNVNQHWNFTQCEIDSGWPRIRDLVTHRQDICRPASVGSSKNKKFAMRPVSHMICWDAHGADGFTPKLCGISNLYAEIEAGTGNITWRLFGCSRGKNTPNGEQFTFRLRKIPLYLEMPISMNNQNSTFNDENLALNYQNLSHSIINLNESLGISYYGMAPNVWHAMADVNAHWLSFHLLKERLHRNIFNPQRTWTIVQIKGTYTHKSNIEYLYSRLWDHIVFHRDPKEYIRHKIQWHSSIKHNLLVRIPNAMFPAIHWFGLPWMDQINCPLNQPNLNPVYLQWQSTINHWMNDLIHKNGRRLSVEICDEKLDRFRLFPKQQNSDQTMNKISQRQGFMTDPLKCHAFFNQMYNNQNHPNRRDPVLFFGDRHLDQKFTEEPCATHRCIANLNETRNRLLERLNGEYAMVMGNPSALSLQSQFELLQQTDVLFGMHGAMFALSQFMRTGSLVYEIQPHTGGRVSTAMANGLGLRYAIFDCMRCDSRIDNIIKAEHAIDGLISTLLWHR